MKKIIGILALVFSGAAFGTTFNVDNIAISGTATATTPATGDNSTKVCTTAYVQSNLASYAPLSGATFTGGITASGITLAADVGGILNVGRLGSAYGGSAINALSPSTFLSFQINNLEAARIDSGGNLLVGTTTSGASNSDSLSFQPAFGALTVNHASGTPSGVGYNIFTYNGTPIGTISQNGTTGITVNGGASSINLGSSISTTTPISTPGYTVATLPTGMPTGSRAVAIPATGWNTSRLRSGSQSRPW